MSSVPLIVACGGLNRSGSTWQFNAARVLLAHAYPDRRIVAGWFDYVEPETNCINIIKAHRHQDISHLRTSAILTCYRDLRDVAGSLVRMKWAPASWSALSPFLQSYVSEATVWQGLADHSFKFEEMVTDQRYELASCSQSLGLRLEHWEIGSVYTKLQSLRPRNHEPTGTLDAVDPHSMLHDGHISPNPSAAREYLPSDILTRISDRYADWLMARGYAP